MAKALSRFLLISLALLVALSVGRLALGNRADGPRGNNLPHRAFGPSPTGRPEMVQPDVQVTGAGSSFDYPFFYKAFYDYATQHGVEVDYQPIGSGGGIQQFLTGTVQFGASDVPIGRLQSTHSRGPLGPIIQVPVVLGAEAISYHIMPGFRRRLHFSGSVLSDIYLGRVKYWDDPEIARLNPGVSLPRQPIIVIHRSDGSGSTEVFTHYLSGSSTKWNEQVGTGKSVAWPTGIGAIGNAGVAGLIQSIPGSLGYVELAYATQAHMTYGSVENAAGRFVLPESATVTSAAAHTTAVSAARPWITNAPGKESYPISSYSWVLLSRHQTNRVQGSALVNLLAWLITAGQRDAVALDYAPLPTEMKILAENGLRKVDYGGRSLLK